jgi:hypothetical protein
MNAPQRMSYLTCVRSSRLQGGAREFPKALNRPPKTMFRAHQALMRVLKTKNFKAALERLRHPKAKFLKPKLEFPSAH